jgi:hypothetical protein
MRNEGSGATSSSCRCQAGAPVTRVVFFSAACFATIAGIQLYLLTEHTDQYFAWTIAQPLSAAFLGGVYWSGAALFLATLTERAWSHVRIAVVAVSAFVALMLLTTLLHLDRFHLRAIALPPLFAAWIWMVVYIAFPLLLVLVIVLQARAPGEDPPRVASLSPIVRYALGLNTLVCLVVCAALFLAPTAMTSVWPWPLTALTGRAVSTGFFVIAAGSFQILRENDWDRDRVGGVSCPLWIPAIVGACALCGECGMGKPRHLALRRVYVFGRWRRRLPHPADLGTARRKDTKIASSLAPFGSCLHVPFARPSCLTR